MTSARRTTLAQPLTLPNGSTLPNRLGKAAMSEQLGTRENAPTEGLAQLYQAWGRGGAGLLITGNVMIDRRALGEPGNVVLEDARHLDLIRSWATAAQAEGAQALVQINHPGRQAPRAATKDPVAPSAVALKGFGGMFAPPRALEPDEIQGLIQRFANTAKLAVDAGFAGVQVHGAHGYLISQFLSPLTNLREDDWGGSPEKRRRFLLEVLRAIRAAVGPGPTVSLKLNSADFQRGGFSEQESMQVVSALNDEAVDLLEISGGTYEHTPWEGTGKQPEQRESTRRREAYFLDYAEQVKELAQMPLMLTGGFRTAAGMEEAIESGAVSVVGLARPLAVEPDLPLRLLSGAAESALAIELRVGIKQVDAFLEIAWYQQQIQRMSRGLDPDPSSCRLTAVIKGLAHAFTHRPRAPRTSDVSGVQEA